MYNDIKKEFEYFFTYEKPIEYKTRNGDILLIYPIDMGNYFEFFASIDCLHIKKDNISDIRIISMSYLDFLYDLIQNDQTHLVESKLCEILHLSLRVPYEHIRFDNRGKLLLIINNIEIGKKDFDNIRRIICYQNMPDFDDSYIDPEIEKIINETKRLSSDTSGTQTSLEYQMMCITASNGMSLEKILSMSIRKFVLLLAVVDAKLHYEIYKTGECSGMVTFKEPITHWMSYKNDKFAGMLSYKSFKEKLKHVI